MKSCFRQGALLAICVITLAGCGNRATKEALDKSRALVDQKQYQPADEVLVAALQAREAQIRAKYPSPVDQAAADDVTKKVQADSEILRMERAQVPIYLHLTRADLASAVYSDILTGDPRDMSVYDFLKDPDPAMRAGAIRVLGLTGKPAAIDALASATKDSDKDVRRAAVAALGGIKDPKAVPPLIGALKDSYWFVRSDAAEALGREADPRAVNPLLDLVADSDSTVESSAENTLVQLAEDKVPVDDFAARVNDPNPKIAAISVVCLGEEHDARALPLLLKMAGASDPAIRLQAVKELGEMGNQAALPTLRQTLNDPAITVRGWSIIGLGKLNDLASVPTLRAMAADSNQPPSIQEAAQAVVNHIVGIPPGSPAAGAASGTP